MKKIIFVTGASSGIGRETAGILAQNINNIVYGGARNMVGFSRVNPLTIDVTKQKSCKRAINKIITRSGRIDVLINCAGYGSMGPVEEVPIDEARNQLDVNVLGIARLSKLVIPYMRKHHYGRIINISSVAGRIQFPFGDWYSASKYAVEGLSNDMRIELKTFGIRVILIEPGSIRSSWNKKAFNNLNKYTVGTPYLINSKHMNNFLYRQSKTKFISSSPRSVARIIKRALKAKHPKAHYLMGRFAHLAVIMQKIMPTFLFDWILKKF